MAINWDEKRAEAAKMQGNGSGTKYPDRKWVPRLTDEWTKITFDMTQDPFEFTYMNSLGKETRKHAIFVTGHKDGCDVMSFTQFQWRTLINALPQTVPDKWTVELKMGINQENGRPVLKTRET